jgi:hypothetical protein
MSGSASQALPNERNALLNWHDIIDLPTKQTTDVCLLSVI